MRDIEEVPIVGSLDNDYPEGDWLCLCRGCGADFHGPDCGMCYKCWRNKYDVEPVSFTVRLPIVIIGYVAILAAILVGVFCL